MQSILPYLPEELRNFMSGKPYVKIDITPMGAPRMTKSDQWKTNPNHPDPRKRQRPCVTRYFAFKNSFSLQWMATRKPVPEALNLLIVISMPDSWSKKKRAMNLYQKHQQKPDRDNIEKGVQDSLVGEDCGIWDGRTTKIWGNEGAIYVY